MDQQDDRCLIVFVREPVAGRVKKRLARDVGDRAARNLYEAFVEDTLRNMEHVQGRLQIHYTPAEALGKIQTWLGDGYEYVAQRGKDLGERMSNAFSDALEQYERVVLIGSDCPDLPAEYVKQAFDSLITMQGVIGPSQDGGYYLMGLSKQNPAAIFEQITWGTPSVYSQTLSRIRRMRLAFRELGVWFDIDTYEDLRQFWQRHKHDNALKTVETLRPSSLFEDGAEL